MKKLIQMSRKEELKYFKKLLKDPVMVIVHMYG